MPISITICILSILLYAFICKIVKKDIRDEITHFMRIENDIYHNDVSNFAINDILRLNQRDIVNFLAIGWPMYYLFLIGTKCGSHIYNTLTRDNYENRIATWFI